MPTPFSQATNSRQRLLSFKVPPMKALDSRQKQVCCLHPVFSGAPAKVGGKNSYDTFSATAPHGPHTAEWRQRPVPASSLWRHLYLKTQDPLWVWGDQPAIDEYAIEPLYFHTPLGWVKVLSTGGATLCHIATLADQQGRTLILCPSTAIKTPRA